MAASSAARLIERLRIGPVCCVSIRNEPFHDGARQCTLASTAAAAIASPPQTALPRSSLPHLIPSRTTVPWSPPNNSFSCSRPQSTNEISQCPRPNLGRECRQRPSAPQSTPQVNTYRTHVAAEKLHGPVGPVVISPASRGDCLATRGSTGPPTSKFISSALRVPACSRRASGKSSRWPFRRSN
jgi:hypothetical protein